MVAAELHESKEYFVYSGNTGVLNGAAYEIIMMSAPTEGRSSQSPHQSR
jgi:hypothetical protein